MIWKNWKRLNNVSLELFFKENPLVALGFSGGVDSSYLLYAGVHFGAKIKAYFVKTEFQPEFELLDAFKLAKQVGIEIKVINLNVVNNNQVISNQLDRCYYCKSAIFSALKKQAIADGISQIIDGTNASDDSSDRPGMKALAELSVRSPLRENGLTKNKIRELSKEANLFTWDKPAYTCLATRIPTGRLITKELLNRVEKAEGALFTMGFTNFRVRVLGEAAKLQFPLDQMNDVLKRRTEIIKLIKPYFPTILLDLEGRNKE